MPVLAAVDNRVVAEAADASPAVCPDRRDRQEHPESRDVQESRVHPVCPETQESHQHSRASQSHRHHANHAQPDHPDLLAHLDRPEILDSLDSLVNPDKMHHRASLDQRDLLDHPDHQANREHLANPVHQLNHNQSCLDRLESPEMPDHLEHLASLANPAKMGHLDNRDQRDLLAHRDRPATMDSPGSRVHLASRAAKARRVFAPSTVPSTVVCSSRTAPGGVKLGERRRRRTDERKNINKNNKQNANANNKNSRLGMPSSSSSVTYAIITSANKITTIIISKEKKNAKAINDALLCNESQLQQSKKKIQNLSKIQTFPFSAFPPHILCRPFVLLCVSSFVSNFFVSFHQFAQLPSSLCSINNK